MHLCIGLNRNHHISTCRKTAGGGGYAINLGADANTLQIEGKENLSVYHAKLYDRGEPGNTLISEAERNFCKVCGSFLWLYDPRWPDLVHPFASAVDTSLPKPPERVHVALEFAAPWCMVPEGENERRFALWPEESIAQWHRRHGLERP
ncbi:MAG TPA: hypothetical protein VHM69_18785 [Rubrobacter sp.]|nr:hypothetical protein [Rubrobacter sp.]